MKRRFIVGAVLGVPLLLLSPTIQDWFQFEIPEFSGDRYALFVLATVITAYGAWPFFVGAVRAVRRGVLDMDVLVTIAVGSGYLFSVAATFWFQSVDFYWEIATLLSVLLFGHWMEMRAIRGTTNALKELGNLLPNIAHRASGEGFEDVPTSSLTPGDVIQIRPGEGLPIDAEIIEGATEIDESMLTGESRPVVRSVGDTVIGGSINGSGGLRVRVTRTGADTTVSQMARLVMDAQASKPPVQRIADRAAHWLTVIAVVGGVGTLAFWFTVGDRTFVAALTMSITVVVIACPHALGLAIPMVTTISTTLGARNGILIKSAEAVEVARRLDVVVFDKTGTLTRGQFGVTAIISAGGWTEDQVLAAAAAVESGSEHPIARGILEEASGRDLELDRALKFQAVPGKGASAEVGGSEIHAGNRAMMEDLSIPLDTIRPALDDLARDGRTLVFVASEDTLRGFIALADIIRDESREVINSLRALGVRTAMLTGDNRGIAAAVGRELGIDTVIAEVLHADKTDRIAELQQDGSRVAMVGDGVNDAAALSRADLGIAIGAGADVAIESADAILMRDDPRDVVRLIKLSNATARKMFQNLAWATGYNVVAIPAAAGVLVPFGFALRPEWGALLMAASSIIVALNALLLRRADLT